MVCGNFILPEVCKPCLFLSFFNLRNLLYLITQSSINRYENGQATPTVELLRKYADYFDVSMDYIFARCDEPQGKLYQAKPPVGEGNPELAQFVEMCFDPSSPMNDKLKKTLIQMLGEAKT